MIKVALVTGATEGIGRQTAIELARRGLRVVVHGRSKKRAEDAATAVSAESGSNAIETAVADLASLAQVRAMAAELSSRHPALDVLLNNAGVFMQERALTEDGFEVTVGVNHFSHFVLTHALLPAVERAEAGRVVHVASGVHTSGEVDLADLNLSRRFSGYGAYASSKLMNVLFSNELARRLVARGSRATSNALHPGVIATKLLRTGFGGGGASLASGARTSVMVATDPAVTATGAYFSAEREVMASARSRDPALMRAFYDKSCELTHTTPL